MLEDDANREEKKKSMIQLKLDAIMETQKKHTKRQQEISEYHKRVESEDAVRLKERMSEINARLESHSARAKEHISFRRNSMERSTSKVFTTLQSARSRVEDELTQRQQEYEKAQTKVN
jgi:CO/xanthine dehydrogenase FAD-binding subunit